MNVFPLQKKFGRLASLIGAGFFALLMAAVYGFSPLYSDNQNQYLLKGLAEAGLGYLNNDRMAAVADPCPLFTWWAALTHRWGGDWLFYIYFGLMMGVYGYTLFRLAAWRQPELNRPAGLLLFLVPFLLIHSNWTAQILESQLGIDLAARFYTGVAGQYLLGKVWEPSVLAVLLLPSLYWFLRERYYLSVVALALAGSVHTSTLWSAGLLTLGYMLTLVRERKISLALRIGGLALLLVLPILIYVYHTFTGADPHIQAFARSIMADFRIAHHTLTEARLYSESFYLRLLVMIGGLIAVRRTRLFPVLLTAFLGGLTGSLVQLWSGSDLLALIFPWRISTLLVPLSTVLILGRVLSRFPARKDFPGIPGLRVWTIAMIAGLMIAGIAVTREEFRRYRNDPAMPMMQQVRAAKKPGDCYLIPALELEQLENFRLETGAPIFVDYKCMPHRAEEVVEWFARLQLARAFYRAGRFSPALLQLIRRREKITHVVTPVNGWRVPAALLEVVYEDGAYRVYRLR